MSQASGTGLVQGMNPETQVVRIKNPTDTPFQAKYLNQTYVINPHSENIVPFLAMCLWLGHPDAVDMPNDPKKEKQYRHQEFERLRTRYGAFDSMEAWLENKPELEAYDLVSGQRLITVVDDYEGLHLKPDSGTSVAERQAMEQAMAQMREQMAQMQAELVRLSQGEAAIDASDIGVTDEKVATPEAAPSDDDEVTTDTPRKVIVG